MRRVVSLVFLYPLLLLRYMMYTLGYAMQHTVFDVSIVGVTNSMRYTETVHKLMLLVHSTLYVSTLYAAPARFLPTTSHQRISSQFVSYILHINGTFRKNV